MNDKQARIQRIYNEARMRGICHNQKEFADLLGINATTLSSAMNGLERALTDRLVKRIERWGEEHLEVTSPATAKDSRPDIIIPAATMELYTSMAKSIDRLTALVERLQPGASSYLGGPAIAPKNYQTK